MKKLLCMLLTATMIISTAATAFAAEEVEAPAEEVIVEEAVEEAAEEVAEEAAEEAVEEIVLDLEDLEDEEIVPDEAIEEEVIEEEAIEEETVEEEIIEEEVIEEAAALEYSAEIGDYNVSLNAAAGVFPNGTTVNVNKASDEKEAEVYEMVKAQLPEDEELVKTITFDFDFADAEGNKVEPDGIVDININAASAFETIESDEDISVAAFHLSDEGSLEKVDASNADGIVSFAAAEFSSYTLVITNHHIPDSKKPSIKAAKLSKSVVNVDPSKYDDTNMIKLSLTLSDDLSGVDHFYCYFTNTSNESEEVYFSSYNADVKDGVWTSESYVSDYVAGKYVCTRFCLYDKAGNELYAYNKSDVPKVLKKLSFTIKRPVSKFKPTVKDLTFNPTTLTLSSNTSKNNVKVSVSATSTGGDISKVEVGIVKSDNSYYRSFWCYKEDYYTANAPYVDSMTFDADTIGTWGIDYIKFAATDGSVVTYAKKDLPSAIAKKTFVVKVKDDKNFPTIKSVKFLKSKATIKDKDIEIPVEITVADKSKDVYSIYVNIYNSKGTRGYYLNNFTKKSDTVFTSTLKISKFAPSDTFKITHAYVKDTAGNTTYYVSDTSYYKDKATAKTKYVKLTSALKKTKLTIKNDYSYTIKFDKNGGKGTMKSIKKCKAGKSYKLTKNKFKKSGYKFVGWNTKKDGTGKTYKDCKKVKNLAEYKGTVTLYAQWKKK